MLTEKEVAVLELKIKGLMQAEIAKKLKISEADVSEAIGIGNTHSSLDMQSDDGGGNLFDLISDESAIKPDSDIDNYFLNNEINELLNTLKHREASVLKLYYGIDCNKPHTLEEIALKYGLTRERIRQIKERALTRLKHPSRSLKLKKFYTE